MKKIFLLAFSLSAFFVSAQQIPLFSQYLNNDFLLNPAISGTKSTAVASISARMQWANFSGAPNTQIGSVHGAFSKNVGIGLAVMNSTAGPTKMTSVQFAYAYRFKINEKIKISFGLAPMIIQHSIAKDKIVLEDANDNTFNKLNGKTMIADLNAGVVVYGPTWTASFSVPQVMENKFRLGDDLFKEKLKRHYILYGAHDFPLKDKKYVLTPSALIKAIEGGGPVQFDVNIKATYNNLFWAGLSYRSSTGLSFNEAAVIFIGVQKYNFAFGYAFDYGFSSMRSYSAGSHEVFLNYKFPCKNCDKANTAADVTPKEAQ